MATTINDQLEELQKAVVALQGLQAKRDTAAKTFGEATAAAEKAFKDASDKADKAFKAASDAYDEKQSYVEALRAELTTTLGDLFPAGNPRVRASK